MSNVCILDIFRKLKERSKIRFVIGPEVKKEVVDDALKGNRFKFSGLRIMRLIKEGIIEVIGNSQINAESQNLLNIANRVYSKKRSNVKVIHRGEMESIALMKFLKTDMLACDETIMRLFLEDPEELNSLLTKRLKSKIVFDKKIHKQFMNGIKIKVIRSVEIAAIAHQIGLFEPFRDIVFRGSAQTLKGVLWALKVSGCGVSYENMEAYVKELVGK